MKSLATENFASPVPLSPLEILKNDTTNSEVSKPNLKFPQSLPKASPVKPLDFSRLQTTQDEQTSCTNQQNFEVIDWYACGGTHGNICSNNESNNTSNPASNHEMNNTLGTSAYSESKSESPIAGVTPDNTDDTDDIATNMLYILQRKRLDDCLNFNAQPTQNRQLFFQQANNIALNEQSCDNLNNLDNISKEFNE